MFHLLAQFRQYFGIVSLLCLVAVGTLFAGTPLLIIRSTASETLLVDDPGKMLNHRACPASTFKLLIAWAALEEGVASPGRTLVCAERHLGGKPRLLDLHHALVLSSNEYFRTIARELGRKRLQDWVEKSGLFPLPLPKTWIDKQLAGAVYGGKLTVTPRALHELMRKIADPGLGTRPDVRADLVRSLEWPSPDPGVKLYGKTGVYNGAVWCTGFGEKEGRKTVITIFLPGTLADRPAVISRFYAEFGLSWAPALLENW